MKLFKQTVYILCFLLFTQLVFAQSQSALLKNAQRAWQQCRISQANEYINRLSNSTQKTRLMKAIRHEQMMRKYIKVARKMARLKRFKDSIGFLKAAYKHSNNSTCKRLLAKEIKKIRKQVKDKPSSTKPFLQDSVKAAIQQCQFSQAKGLIAQLPSRTWQHNWKRELASAQKREGLAQLRYESALRQLRLDNKKQALVDLQRAKSQTQCSGMDSKIDGLIGKLTQADETEKPERKPNCAIHMIHSSPAWNPVKKEYTCECDKGYASNVQRNRCIKKEVLYQATNRDCMRVYPGSIAVWGENKQYKCDCPKGKEWNGDHSACVSPGEMICTGGRVKKGKTCTCPEGLQWSPVHKVCFQKHHAGDCSKGMVLRWSREKEEYECNCPDWLEWNNVQKRCAKPSYSARNNNCPEGTRRAWSEALDSYYCYCPVGSFWNKSKKMCTKYLGCSAGRVTRWDSTARKYVCGCPKGTVWDARAKRCASPNRLLPNCPGNSKPYWSSLKKKYLCKCAVGLRWDKSRKICYRPDPRRNPAYIRCPKNSYRVWNKKYKRYQCYCYRGMGWSNRLKRCVKLQPRNITCSHGYYWSKRYGRCVKRRQRSSNTSSGASAQQVINFINSIIGSNNNNSSSRSTSRSSYSSSSRSRSYSSTSRRPTRRTISKPNCSRIMPGSRPVYSTAYRKYVCKCPRGYYISRSGPRRCKRY